MQEESINSFPCFVADTSFMAAYLLCRFCDDEFVQASSAIENVINNNGQIYVPQLFWYEISNVLLYKSKPDKSGNAKISVAQASEILSDLSQLPIYTDLQSDFETLTKIRDIAITYDLSFYDASYVELARRYNLPVMSFDKRILGAIGV